MQSKFTQKILGKFCMNVIAVTAILLSFFQTSQAQVLFSQGFDVAAPLPAGWASQNLSAPVGTLGWFQGNPTVFTSNSGVPASYIAANFNSTGNIGTISNWLFTPTVTLKNGDIFSFYTRVPTGGAAFPDRLQVRMSTSGASVNVGATATSVGDFSTLLLDINPTYGAAYPEVWTQFNVTISGLAAPISGRLAFRYFVENGGATGANSNFIGIDDVVYTTFAGPCAGTPDPGNTISSVASVCPATNFTLSVQNNPAVSGLTYQWQSSPDGITWTNIAGATSATLVRQQAVGTYYRLQVTCAGVPGNSTALLVPLSTICYCTAGATSTGFEKIGRVQFNTINNPSTSTAGYENFTAINTNLTPGIPYTLTVTITGGFAADQVIAWIDYNQNGSFNDAGEAVYTSALGVGPHTGTIIVPFSALPGSTRMRVRMHDSSLGPNATSCGTSTYGQVEDYTVIIATTSPCSGTPAPGNTLSSVTTVCTGTNFTLSLQNLTAGSGVSYQWQSSPTGAAGTFTNITGATNSFYVATQTAATSYQAIVTCGTASTTSNPVRVLLTPFIGCYCIPPTTDCTDGDVILNVTFGSSLNNTSPLACTSPNGYINYMTTVDTTDIIRGAANPISVRVGNGGTEFVSVWIDYNQNGVYEASEFTAVGSGNNVTLNGTINVPATALLGATGMRVRVRFATALTGAQACAGGFTYGETEDYIVNIVPCVQGVINTQPVNRTIGCSGNTTFSVAATGSLLSYQWEYRTSATGPWLLVPNTAPFSGANTNTLALTTVPTTFNNYQFRVVISGPCTAPDISSTATLTVGPLVATTNVASANICAGTIQQLSITNTAPPTTSVFPATTTPVNLVIPDLNGPPVVTAAVADAGVNHTIPVNIPAGSIIANMRVRLNITHPYVSDLVVVLRAPNGQILNLSYHKGGTGTAGANFTNVVFSSAAGLPLVSSGAAPGYTGTYRPDASIGAGTFADPSGSGPTGFAPTVTTFAGLYSIPSGNWTIGLADPSTWAGDQGVLNNWSLEFDYGAPSTGIFTGPNIFTNAAGTIPYNGTTPISTVFVNPTTTTTYGLVVTNPLCVSDTLKIPVTVSTPISGVTTAATTRACVGGNTTFTVTSAAGNLQTIQWQVSTGTGNPFTNIANGGVYSGATGNTLTITGATASLSGYRFRARVSNPCNIDSSNISVLTVNPNPIVTLSASPNTQLLPGLTTTLTATVGPNAAATYNWFRNGLPLTSATGNSLVVDVDGLGDYSVTVTDINGCTSSSNIVSITDSTSDMMFIYPSPNTGQFQVRFNSQGGNTNLPRTVNVYDAKGSRIYSRSYPINVPYERLDVDLRNHGKGIYMVELADRNGSRIKAGRVVIL